LQAIAIDFWSTRLLVFMHIQNELLKQFYNFSHYEALMCGVSILEKSPDKEIIQDKYLLTFFGKQN
jgi:hypothetical protein